jgi:hypothetical protein
MASRVARSEAAIDARGDRNIGKITALSGFGR